MRIHQEQEEEDNYMKTINKLDEMYKQAFKEKKEAAVLTLRSLKAEIKNKEIEKKKELTEEEIIKVVKTEIKKRQDAIEQYEKGDRPELAKKEAEESKILEQFLPEQMSDEELEKIVKTVVEKNLDFGPNFGKIMGEVMKEVGDKADGSKVSQMVKKILDQS